MCALLSLHRRMEGKRKSKATVRNEAAYQGKRGTRSKGEERSRRRGANHSRLKFGVDIEPIESILTRLGSIEELTIDKLEKEIDELDMSRLFTHFDIPIGKTRQLYEELLKLPAKEHRRRYHRHPQGDDFSSALDQAALCLIDRMTELSERITASQKKISKIADEISGIESESPE